jgi:putative sterol carrier protein
MSALRLDPERVVATARRRIARAPEQVANRLARIVRDSPESRLDLLMRSPARRAILDGIFWQIPQRLSYRRAAGLNAVIEWQITGRPDGSADTYQLTLADGRAQVRRGSREPNPLLTITLDGADFLKLVTGNADPMKSYFAGKIKLAGNIMLGARLQSLFRIPAARKPGQPPGTSRAT